MMTTLLDLSPDQLLDMYRRMCLIRSFEEHARELYMQGRVRGSTHMYIGEEAVAAGACAALRRDDYITSTHRGHGHCLAKGGQPAVMMAELLGKATGYCHGKGGSMHIADLDLGILGANGIVGGGIGIATGAAYTCKVRGAGQVVCCFFGDGALNQGIFHESANMAGLWRLPVIYLCEENKYAEFSPNAGFFPVHDLTVRAAPYGFPGVAVDGNNALAVHRAVQEAVDRARSGGGPALIVADTYRIEGHTIGDPLTLRPKDEAEEWRKRDPIVHLRHTLKERGMLDDGTAEKIAAETEQEIETAVEFALSSPDPDVSELWRDVY
ncbi:MAG: thiamine pyrophosphate-dependent dehydrogenase E1 component subunit alpha [Chloroflexi bacterium]|nr:thiamine pyrophosphate-dependent dehydrogenase E1 component subunit alpha [Chloroflexota bacterium]